tara:strand:+ start:1565 stop:1780 length:216 start_codon:yes stop_codon:yes gene_type:complete
MNKHIKNWIDTMVLDAKLGTKITASGLKTQLIRKHGTTYVCTSSTIGWYLSRNKNIKFISKEKGIKVYVRE